MKLVVKVPNGFGKIVNDVSDHDLCVPIKVCVGSYIYRTHAYAMFDDKAKVLLSDIDWLQQPGSIEKEPEQNGVSKRVEYGTDGNLYEMSISNGKEYDETIPPERMTPSENRAYWGIYS